MGVSNEETKLHRNSRDFRDFFTEGESPITPVLQFEVINHKDNMHHCHYEVRKRVPNGNIPLQLSLSLFKTTKVIIGNIHRSERIIEINNK